MKRENERIEEKKRRGKIRDAFMAEVFFAIESKSYDDNERRFQVPLWVSRKWFVC